MLTAGAQVLRKSAFSALRSFVSADGLIRAGSRLAQSPLDFIEKYPIVLPRRSPLTLLLVREAHVLALHGGSLLTRSVLSRHYWILQANRIIRSEIQRCVRRARLRGAITAQQMGQLSTVRVSAVTLVTCIMPNRYECGIALPADLSRISRTSAYMYGHEGSSSGAGIGLVRVHQGLATVYRDSRPM